MEKLELPDELILKIFKNLPLQDLFSSVALVNKQFYKITKDSDLLKNLTLQNIDKYVYEETVKVLKNATKLEKLTISENVLNPEKLIKIAFQASKSLNSLKIDEKITEKLA